MYLVPEAARRSTSGEDARSILTRCLGLIVTAGVPMVLIYAIAARPLLEIVFGEDLALASGALPWLGIAMVLLACTYLSVQYLLALHRYGFIWLLAAALVVETLSIVAIGDELTQVALTLLVVQGACAAFVLSSALRAPTPSRVHA
jgi:O-antigen/teichoic acid export membrane protein